MMMNENTFSYLDPPFKHILFDTWKQQPKKSDPAFADASSAQSTKTRELKKEVDNKPLEPPVGWKIRKYFPGFGWYIGTILEKSLIHENEQFFRVYYAEDSDVEDLPLEEIQHLRVGQKQHMS